MRTFRKNQREPSKNKYLKNSKIAYSAKSMMMSKRVNSKKRRMFGERMTSISEFHQI